MMMMMMMMCISFAKAHCQAFELVTTTERLQVGGGYTVLIKNYLN